MANESILSAAFPANSRRDQNNNLLQSPDPWPSDGRVFDSNYLQRYHLIRAAHNVRFEGHISGFNITKPPQTPTAM